MAQALRRAGAPATGGVSNVMAAVSVTAVTRIGAPETILESCVSGASWEGPAQKRSQVPRDATSEKRAWARKARGQKSTGPEQNWAGWHIAAKPSLAPNRPNSPAAFPAKARSGARPPAHRERSAGGPAGRWAFAPRAPSPRSAGTRARRAGRRNPARCQSRASVFSTRSFVAQHDAHDPGSTAFQCVHQLHVVAPVAPDLGQVIGVVLAGLPGSERTACRRPSRRPWRRAAHR